MRRAPLVALSLTVALAASCSKSLPPLPPAPQVPEPAPAQVETILFLIGDVGDALPGRSPVLSLLHAEVERWSRELARDSAVGVIFLGDNVYPAGLRDPGTPERAGDVPHLLVQAAVVSGPEARAHHSPAFFVAGNHDYGQHQGPVGLARARTEDSFLDSLRARGAAVELLPDPGSLHPGVVDLGQHLRLILLDTAWWLLGSTRAEQTQLMSNVAQAMRSAGGRSIIVASHHPWESASSHGGLVPFWRTVGVRFLLARSGALLQDLNSIPYQHLRQDFRAIFATTGTPVLYAGGHDHSLQFFDAVAPDDPRHMLVSGAGSKTAAVGNAPGMRYRGGHETGYARLFVLKDGSVILSIVAAPGSAESCGANDAKCMRTAMAAFKVAYTERLR